MKPLSVIIGAVVVVAAVVIVVTMHTLPGRRTLSTATVVPSPPQQAIVAPSTSPATGGCMISGCSSQVCSDAPVVTTCEWRQEYICYRTAACERQDGGRCGWTQTPNFVACLQQFAQP